MPIFNIILSQIPVKNIFNAKSSILKYLNSYFTAFVHCLTVVCHGQSVQSICKPDVINFIKQTYNAQYQNWDIAQDSLTKFIYFANSKGLLEYDGATWKVYELPENQKIRSVAIDNEGKIYTGALGEFGFWSPNKSGRLTYHSLKKLIKENAFPNEEIWNILITTKGIIFQSFAYLYLYNPINNQVKKLNPPGNMLFVQQVNERFFVEIIDKGLYELKINNQSNTQFSLIEGSEFLSRESVNAILPYQENEILVGTNKGIYRYNGIKFSEFNKTTNLFIQQHQLNRGIYLGNQIYAFGTILNGVILTNQTGEIIQFFNKNQGLQNNTVLSLSNDIEGNLWVGMDKGIDLIVLSSPLKYYNDSEGQLGTVYDVAIHQGYIYLGTNQGVFCRNLAKKNTNFSLVPKTQGQVWDLEVIDNQLLCGHNNGTFLIENNQATQISNITGGWVIKKMQKHPELLIQGTYTNLCIYKKAVNGKWIFDHMVEGYSAPTRRLEEDKNGDLWLSKRPFGIIKLHLSENTQKIESQTIFDIAELKGAEVSMINQQIIVTSVNGILEFNPNLKVFKPAYSLQKAMGNDIARKVFSFSENNNATPKNIFVIKKDGGLGVITPNGKQILIPMKENQWVDDYENIVSIDAETYLLCSENGFILLPQKAIFQQISPKVMLPVIREIIIQDFPDLNQTFRSANITPKLSLDYDQNSLTIFFATPNYGNSVKYSYLLENSSRNWSSFQNISQKDFNNLSPGQYIFHLKSDLNPQESLVIFEIKQPWYWNFWSRLCYFLLLVSLAWLSFELHLRKVKFKQAQIREKLEKQLERQAEISTNEIMQLRNEQLEKNIISKSEELANSTMAVIKKNELLLTIKQGLTKLKSESDLRSTTPHLKQVLHLVDSNISTEHDWQVFENNFNQVHEEFIKKLLKKYPNLTPSDVKLAAYLRMNLSTKEIAHLLNITNRSVELKRYRLRKKINLDSEINLGEFMMAY